MKGEIMADVEKALYQQTPFGFEPANELATDFHKGGKIGNLVELKGSRPRHPIFHRFWWRMLRTMSEHSEPFMSVKQLDFMAKVGTGTGQWHKVYSAKAGKQVPVFLPGSISFAAMDQVQFRAFTKEAAEFLCSSFLPGVVPDDFLRDFERLAI